MYIEYQSFNQNSNGVIYSSFSWGGKKAISQSKSKIHKRQTESKKNKEIRGGADEVQDAKKETSELYPYLGWLDVHVINRRRSKGSIVSVSESSSLAEESDDSESDAKSDGMSEKSLESKAVEASTSEERYSKTTGQTKWEKREKKSAKKDVD